MVWRQDSLVLYIKMNNRENNNLTRVKAFTKGRLLRYAGDKSD